MLNWNPRLQHLEKSDSLILFHLYKNKESREKKGWVVEYSKKIPVYVYLLFINWKKNSSISSHVVKMVEITISPHEKPVKVHT